MARTILRKKRLASMVKTHSSPTASQRAHINLQLLVFTSVCNLLKLVKSSYSNNNSAASFILSKSRGKDMRAANLL